MLRRLSLGFLAVWFLVAVGGCSPDAEPVKARQLYIFNWEGYFAPDTLENFEKEFGVQVVLETFDSEEEMLAGLQSQPGRYDVVVASDSMVWTLRQLKLLAELDPERIPNLANIGQQFRGLPFDTDNRYSVPYLWGTTGLAVNTSYIREGERGWEVLWDAAYKGHLAMLNDAQEVSAVALLALGYSLNSRQATHLQAAEQKLLEQQPLLAGYLDSLSIVDGLVSEELWAAQLYNGDALAVAESNPSITYVIPEQGAALWVDNLVIPLGAPDRDEAQVFINYILRPEVSAAIVNYLYYATANHAAEAYIQREILEDPSIYPALETMSRLEYYQPLDEETNQRLNRIWVRLANP
ncbi:MAG: spermidine/putrescine ABC transporter substrate-binding protein [Chloroflexi bacterium]|nr:spermidine/putrescine ABC transporter substrate-binding protein [Chloroflexota bacterium]